MRRLRTFGLVFALLALTGLAAGSGCAGKDTGKGTSSTTKTTTTSTTTSDKDKSSTTTTTTSGSGPVEWKNTVTLKGQVTYDGTPPPVEKLNFGDKADAHCLKGDTEKLIWEVDPNSKGVKNVVVWVQPGPGQSFKYDAIPEALRKRTDTVAMDQPHCNFVPHVQAFNPSIFDGKKQVPTGQKFVMKNTAPIAHNSKYEGDAALATNSGNPNIPPKGQEEFKVKPARDTRSGHDLVNINCGIHPWMSAKLLALDTPFYAITDKDGKFEIKDVPAGVAVHVVAWHEEAGANGYVLPAGSAAKQGQKMTLEAGKNDTLNFSIKKN